jgi:thiol-disulfide isomerase/thioredoxin
MKKFLMMAAALLLTLQTAYAAKTFTIEGPGAPTIVATELPNGMTFKGYEGKPVLLNFFGKRCRYCKKEIPHLAKLKAKYGDKIVILGMHVQQRMLPQERSAIIKDLGINYPVYEYDDNVPFIYHVGARAGYNGSIPFNIFFNRKGEVAEIIPGYIGEKDLEMIFSDLVGH